MGERRGIAGCRGGSCWRGERWSQGVPPRKVPSQGRSIRLLVTGWRSAPPLAPPGWGAEHPWPPLVEEVVACVWAVGVAWAGRHWRKSSSGAERRPVPGAGRGRADPVSESEARPGRRWRKSSSGAGQRPALCAGRGRTVLFCGRTPEDSWRAPPRTDAVRFAPTWGTSRPMNDR